LKKVQKTKNECFKLQEEISTASISEFEVVEEPEGAPVSAPPPHVSSN
jgi:hypothetical protein